MDKIYLPPLPLSPDESTVTSPSSYPLNIPVEEKKIADEIISYYTKYGSEDYIGEKVSQSSHMIQCAMLAEKDFPDDHEIIIGAFLHDIGQLLVLSSEELQKKYRVNKFGVEDHEHIGAEYLKKLGFSDKICSIVRNHVSGKRYLCAVDPEYYDKLSEASKTTLIEQGGPFNEEEIKKYKEDPNWKIYVKMRIWDDKAKIEYDEKEINSIQYYNIMIKNYLQKNIKI